ncbi:MAG TPA: hypothetical protein VF976_10745 [Gemmatimonadales bacterium]
MPRYTVAVAFAMLAGAACPGGQSRQSPNGAPGAPAASARPDPAFAGTTARLHRVPPGSGAPAAMLRSVTAATARGYDRVVFEFASDSAPGYHVEYASGPVRRCGSGDVVSVAGTHRLVVRFEPARAHDDQGNPIPQQREVALELPAVKEMKLVCDFESQVEWVIGVAGAKPFRVSELTGPARLLLDVKQGT